MRHLITTCLMLALTTAIGCGTGDSPSPEASASKAPAKSQKPMHPAAKAASQFLQASATGKMETARSLLTPLAFEQLEKSDATLVELGVDSPKFEITRLLLPQEDEAAVEYRLQFVMDEETAMIDCCCFLKNIEGNWRVAGMALDPGDGSSPVVHNYEEDLSRPAAASANPAAAASASPVGGQTPQTAQNPGQPQPY